MKSLLIAAMFPALFLMGCDVQKAEADNVWYEKSYDPQYGVVCYKTAGGSISCVKVN